MPPLTPGPPFIPSPLETAVYMQTLHRSSQVLPECTASIRNRGVLIMQAGQVQHPHDDAPLATPPEALAQRLATEPGAPPSEQAFPWVDVDAACSPRKTAVTSDRGRLSPLQMLSCWRSGKARKTPAQAATVPYAWFPLTWRYVSGDRRKHQTRSSSAVHMNGSPRLRRSSRDSAATAVARRWSECGGAPGPTGLG
ncbi:hypothetical protein GSI_03446 [Ganoderma sinense ZZ0214-1]|uniref:Uncharacterized protein n=1 Tax=Ganoderma sinense ZZ0214-1 TaxID=1077348 RepID=A0A2G8SLK5_9APHY|nr:hypothetical protein GSI_03446 [Ganoderma sinense ZZ0214-1]